MDDTLTIYFLLCVLSLFFLTKLLTMSIATLYQGLPDSARTKIRDYILDLQIVPMVEKCIDVHWMELQWQSRNVNTWNVLLLPDRKMTSEHLLRIFRDTKAKHGKNRARRAIKEYIVRFSNKRLKFAEGNTPSGYTGFERPRPGGIRWRADDLYQAVVGKHPNYEDTRTIPVFESIGRI